MSDAARPNVAHAFVRAVSPCVATSGGTDNPVCAGQAGVPVHTDAGKMPARHASRRAPPAGAIDDQTTIR